MLMSSRGKALAGCGKVRRLGVEVLASEVSCGKAIRIVAVYQQSGLSRGAPKKGSGLPGWECSNGDRLGNCSRGSCAPGASMIEFPFLEAPGERRLEAPVGLDRAAGRRQRDPLRSDRLTAALRGRRRRW